MEAVLRKIGHLRNLEHLRLVISNDTEHAFANANAAANNPAGPANQNQGEECRLAYSATLEHFEGAIRKSVLEMLSNLTNQLTRLELNGSWICDSLVIQMPCLPNLEALRLIPSQSRVVVYGLVSKIHSNEFQFRVFGPYKVGYVFPMIILSEFPMCRYRDGKQRDGNQRDDAPLFRF